MAFFVIETESENVRFWAAATKRDLIAGSGINDASPIWGVFSTSLQDELEVSGYDSLGEAWEKDRVEAAFLSRLAKIASASPVGRIVTIHRGELIERFSQNTTCSEEHWRSVVAREYIIQRGGQVFDSWGAVARAGYSHHPTMQEAAEQMGDAYA